jgi:hypothetical protein
MESPPNPARQRLRTLRRRVAAGVIATFVAAWLAVAALGKGGGSNTAVANPTPSDATGTQSAPDDGGPGGSDDGSSQAPSRSSGPGPVTTEQS